MFMVNGLTGKHQKWRFDGDATRNFLNKRCTIIYLLLLRGSVIFNVMLLFLVLVIGIFTSCTMHMQSNTGTTFFFNKDVDSDCWNKEDIDKLRARMIFNKLIPKEVTPDKINKSFIKNTLRYFRESLRAVDKQEYSQEKGVLREALADTLGGYLRSELLPATRLAYYAGFVPFKSAKELHDLYNELKMTLNTEGLGWKPPSKIPQICNLTVVKIKIGTGKLLNPCKRLIIKRDLNRCIKLPIPRVDDAKEPTAILLPYKNGGLVSLLSSNAENILLKYYTTAARCLLRRSPVICRHSDVVHFNNDVWNWMKSDVAPHLMDETLYAAYGGVLRIAGAVQSYGKVLSRRNLFDINKEQSLKPPLWSTLTQPYLLIDADWTPSLYIAIVVFASLAICFLQLCYNFVLGNVHSCCCVAVEEKKHELHHHDNDNFYCNETQWVNYSANQSKGNRQIKTQRLYDCNENLLDVVMSDAKDDSDSSDTDNVFAPEASRGARSTSPPKIETSIEQLKIDKGRVRLEVKNKAAWLDKGSSSDSESLSSGSSTSRPRDLAWARRVVGSEQRPRPRPTPSLHTDINSFTSTSRR